MNMYRFTEKGQEYETFTPERQIAEMKERIAALEKANSLMREALYAAKSLMESVKDAASKLAYVSTIEHFNVVDSALKASNAVHDMATALAAFREAKKT